jgi:hypothetical protein
MHEKKTKEKALMVLRYSFNRFKWRVVGTFLSDFYSSVGGGYCC